MPSPRPLVSTDTSVLAAASRGSAGIACNAASKSVTGTRRVGGHRVKVAQPRGRMRGRPILAPIGGIELQACGLEKASARLHQRMFAVDVTARHAAIHFFRIAAVTGVIRRGDIAIDQIAVDEQLPHAAERRFQRRRQGTCRLRREAVCSAAGVELPKLAWPSRNHAKRSICAEDATDDEVGAQTTCRSAAVHIAAAMPPKTHPTPTASAIRSVAARRSRECRRAREHSGLAY